MTLFNHYHEQQLTYKESGSADFQNAIENETDPNILALLALEIPRLDNPQQTISVKNSVLYQLGAIELEDL